MKKINVFLGVLIVIPIISFSQITSGKITYKASVNAEDYLNTLENDSETPDLIRNDRKRLVSEAKPINFFLIFDGNESIFIPENDVPTNRKLGLLMNWTGVASRDSFNYYTDLTKKETYGQSYWLDRINIIYNDIEWELTQETKKIGDYTCYKAVAIIEDEQEYGMNYVKPVVAWYTPQIPISHGIQQFSGLPGLILEMDMFIEYGAVHYVATSIELNIEIDQKIENNKGKVINEQEYFELLEELNSGR